MCVCILQSVHHVHRGTDILYIDENINAVAANILSKAKDPTVEDTVFC